MISLATAITEAPAAPSSARALPVVPPLTGYTDPFRFAHPDNFKALMLEALTQRASDVFVQPMLPICARVNGRMVALTRRPIDDAEVKLVLKWTAGRDTALTDILEGKPVNARYELFDPTLRAPSGARVRYGYRVNATPVLHEGALSAQIVVRTIPDEPPTTEQVGLNEEILTAATPRDGIVYIAGATGSGKTTTFAAILRYILEHDTPIKGNIITAEEPIEFRFHTIRSAHSIIVQTQVPDMICDFYAFIREAMRRAPKLIMIGELRDQQTIRAAVEASLTGHPVFGTVHANGAAAVMRRLISRFPESERATAIFDLVETARFIMAQRLVPTRDGKLTAAREYLVFDEAVRERLISLDQMGKVTQVVKELVEERGHSFRTEAKCLLSQGLIDEHVARELART
ncbi:MAG: Type secretion system protein DotB [Gammaproteobacteria bacterium]|nr:Type secretion system protein DotB [Gammaproteobacteria bacterium]